MSSLEQSLLEAARAGAPQLVDDTLRRGVAVDVADAQGGTALMLATCREVVLRLLEAGARVGARDGVGNTPLHYAGRQVRIDKARLLLRRGGDPGARNLGGQTPWDLMLACAQPYYTSLVLMEIDAKNEAARRALVSRSEDRWELQLLGVWRSDAQRERGERLHEAIDTGEPEAVASVLGEGPLVETLDRYGRTPVMHAVSSRRCGPAVLEALLAAGASARKLRTGHGTPESYARETGRVELVRVLAPDAEIGPTLESGVWALELVDTETHEIVFYPNMQSGRCLTLARKKPRHLEGGASLTVAGALEGHRKELQSAGAAWLIPLLERVAEGKELELADVDAAYSAVHGRPPHRRYYMEPVAGCY